MIPIYQIASAALLILCVGCGRTDGVADPAPPITAAIIQPIPPIVLPAAEPTTQTPEAMDWQSVEGLPQKLALFDHVFWEPDDTGSLRRILRSSDVVRGKSVLEIGTGTGIVALCCAQAGASHVVATDINPWAIRNCVFNAKELKFETVIEPRQVPLKTPDAWSVIGDEERFDVIVSNPPWELGKPTRVEDFAFYDPDFQLMKSLVTGLPGHLKPNGRVFLAYGCVTAIRQLQTLITAEGMTYTVLDDRDLDTLAENFLPGMLIEVHATP